MANWCLELGEKTLFTSEENKIALADVEEQALAVIFEGRQAPKSVRSLLSQVNDFINFIRDVRLLVQCVCVPHLSQKSLLKL